MIYVISPYSHSNPEIIEQRYIDTVNFVIYLAKKNIVVFSPIVYCHNMAMIKSLPTDAKYWEIFNMEFMKKSKEAFLLNLHGIENSIGCKFELKYFLDNDKKVTQFNKHNDNYLKV